MTLSPASIIVIVGDRLADLAAQPLGELVGFEDGLARVAARRGSAVVCGVRDGFGDRVHAAASALTPKTSQPTASQSG